MAEELKPTPNGEALGDCAADLRSFARALVGPVSSRTADGLAQAALTRAGRGEQPSANPREAAFAEAVRLNRRRVRERGRAPNPADPLGVEAERGVAPFAAQVATMPLDEREALLVVALAGFGYAAAARILDVPLSSVVSRLMRARARLDGAGAGPVRKSGHLRVVK